MASRRALIGIATAVWLMASLFVLKSGVEEYAAHLDALLVALTVVVFLPFFFMFQSIARKNRVRISNLPTDRNNPLSFFTLKSYLVVAFMMTLGAVLRSTPAVPRFFIAFFYVGLGTALLSAAVSYLRYFAAYERYRAEDRAGRTSEQRSA
ncbi:hypothetical protein [Berryella wangjianweii]|uniref:hypothetical protein n=1 Tax=Berryella wangjianweii TaxID=2734634 RepID=UPI0021BD119F|nr:hypothetical protein [Berryella wangjianweii]